ncbi:MAG: phosphodiester glycosidase family protein [Armatimonadetes bacterium]|nr:phosphodiester glycosidase family protein [Armatimonadota bacterium]
MRNRSLLLALTAIGALLPARVLAASVAYAARTVGGVKAHVITVNMNDPDVKVSTVLAQDFPGGDEPFTSLVKRSGAVAAVDGTFFDKYTRIPIGDIVINGKQCHQGRMGTAMAITPQNKVLFGRVVWGHAADWTGYETVLACGPTLVKSGQVDLKVSEERFRDPHVLGSGVRVALGLTAANKLLLVAVPRGITLAKLAETMKALGCVEAMNLDGGASMAMCYRGKVVVPAGRRLTNALVVYETSQHVQGLEPPAAHPEGNGGQPPRWAQRGLEAVPEGIPIYPGATARPLTEWTDAPPVYATNDGFDAVLAHYRSELGERARVQTFAEGEERTALVRVTSGAGAGTLVQVVRRGAGPTILVISPAGTAVPSHFFWQDGGG